jgi:hypothetical protein
VLLRGFHCRDCGYSGTSVEDHCPECGSLPNVSELDFKIDLYPEPSPSNRSRPYFMFFILLGLLALVFAIVLSSFFDDNTNDRLPLWQYAVFLCLISFGMFVIVLFMRRR